MKTTELLSRARTLLDESSSGFWEDSEIYRSLSDGIKSLVRIHLAIWKAKSKVNPSEPLPETLRPLYQTTTGTGTTNLPPDFMDYLSLKNTADNSVIYIRDNSKAKVWEQSNTYLASDSTNPYAYFSDTQIVLETSVSWEMEYLKIPDDVDGSTDPELPDTVREALVDYAFSDLMRKDRKLNESAEAFNRFMQAVQQIY